MLIRNDIMDAKVSGDPVVVASPERLDRNKRVGNALLCCAISLTAPRPKEGDAFYRFSPPDDYFCELPEMF